MIVRMSRALVRPGREEEFRSLIVGLVADYPSRHDGLLAHDVLISEDGSTLIYQSRWRDEASLAAFAGPAWRRQPVVFPGEEEYLREPLQVTHFVVTAAYPDGR